ncbi:PAS domain S-box protein [Massilia forsythiae]|uniref:histidine kinase n=1 Tax=Massilia forsythiae TaxID=2728020 RepID=A0A7Z2ZVA8_9BURK|nr:sensor histidine kinase [Massilia forsythiae]QJE01902.1 PAS domain S-box protein [Massilia forsythiae]
MADFLYRLHALRPRGLAGYLALAFSALSIVLTVVVVAVVEREASRHVTQTIGHGLGELALQASDKLDRGMFERYREVSLIARRFSRADADLSHDGLRALLDDVRDTYSYYSWIGLTDLQGKVMVSAGGLLEGADVSRRPWFKEGGSGGHVGDVHEALLLARLLPQHGSEPVRFVDVAFPIYDLDGRPTGVLGAHLSWQWARDVERSIIAPLQSQRNVDALIVGANGTVLLGPPELLGARIDVGRLRVRHPGAQSGYALQRWPDGKTYMVGFSRSRGYADYPGLGWTVLVREDLDSAFVPVRRLRSYGLWSGVALALLFSLAGVFLARWITRPLMQLKREAARIQDGDGTALTARMRGYDEVQTLTRALNNLLLVLQRRQAQMEELNLTLEQRVEDRTQALAQALAAVQRNEQRIATIIETAQDAFIGIDLRGMVIDWSSQAERLFGWSHGEALGRSLGELVVPQRFQCSFAKALQRFHDTGHLGIFERRAERIVRDRRGNELSVEMTVRLAGADGARFFSIFVHDISLRKKVEQMKNELVATVSHELRTPLTSMRASLSLLASNAIDGVPDDARELVDIAHRHCERLVRMVNDMLDVQKIESGKVQLNRSMQPVLPVVRDAVAAMQGYAQQAGVEIVCGGSCDEALRAEVDGDRLTQVITNLLSNAIKFSPPGERVVVELGRHREGLRLAVLDRGPGIPADFRSQIFGRFAQADDEGVRRQGSGLGLSISKTIVEEHGGHLGFSDREGGGTAFHVYLPLAGSE